jgi:hypothetical protein
VVVDLSHISSPAALLPDVLAQLPKSTSWRLPQDARCTNLHESALAEHGDGIKIENRFDAVCDCDDGVVCKATPDQTLEEGVGLVIQAAINVSKQKVTCWFNALQVRVIDLLEFWGKLKTVAKEGNPGMRELQGFRAHLLLTSSNIRTLPLLLSSARAKQKSCFCP